MTRQVPWELLPNGNAIATREAGGVEQEQLGAEDVQRSSPCEDVHGDIAMKQGNVSSVSLGLPESYHQSS